MKRKIGKIILPIMALLLVAITLFVIFSRTQAVPIGGTYPERLGSFTGPVGGNAQDDNIKASLDLAHIDLDAQIRYDVNTMTLLGLGDGGVFYVNSAASGTTGVSWATAVNDLEEVQALLSGSCGEVVFIAPGHVETIGGAKAIDLDVADVTYIGLGAGNTMPKFTYDTNVDSIAIGAAGDGVKIKNLRFVSSVTAVANAIIVEAGCTDFVIEDCVFEAEATTVDEFIDTILISGTASDRGKIINCRFLGDVGANAGPKASINFVDCDYLQIIGCEFSGDIGDAHIFNETTASNYITIKDNFIYCGYIGGNLDTTPGISLVATTSGWIADNVVVTDVATPEDAIVAADCYLFNNRYSETESTAGSHRIGTANQKSGTYILVTSTVTSDQVPNNTQTAGAVTGAADGTLLLIEIYGNTGATTGLEGPTNFEFTVDNVAGLTGAAAPIALEAEAGLDNDICWVATVDATSHNLPLQLESGKKIFIHGDDGAGTGSGTCNFTLVFQRITDGAHIAGNDGPS